ncbi:MAG: hypothetical protein C0392_14990 [Syntrophus sp. (in: bacteria)]|nr:hypothetical protein [Syntrophus sp. (in: bacteria)]
MVDKDFLEYLKLAHGSFNIAILLMFFYQGWMGLLIRKRRKGGNPPYFGLIKKHRKLGPILVLLGVAGFLAGPMVVYIDNARIFEYPLHFILGICIAVSLITAYIISRKIRVGSPWRTPHFAAGIAIVCLYIVQTLIGLSMLLL